MPHLSVRPTTIAHSVPYWVRIPTGSDISHRGCATGVCRAVYVTVHYKEPFKSLDRSIGHSPESNFFLSQYYYAEGDINHSLPVSRPGQIHVSVYGRELKNKPTRSPAAPHSVAQGTRMNIKPVGYFVWVTWPVKNF